MKLKKISALVICVAMVVSAMGMTAFGVSAEGAIATVVEVSTNEALATALNEGNDVKITDNFTVDTGITVPDGAVIDLNGKTLNWNVENSYFGESTVKNGSIVVGKDDVHVCDGYFLVNEGKTLTVDGVSITASDEGIKCYAVFHLKTGAGLDLKNSAIDVANNEYTAGYIVYAGEATAKFSLIDSAINSENIAGVVHAETTITDSSLTIKGTGTMEHGINRSALTITNSTVTISGGTGRGITSEHGDLVIDGNSAVTVYDMAEATIELRGDKSMTVADTATVIADVAVNNTTSGTVTGTVTVQTVPDGTSTAKVTLNGEEKDSLAQAILEAKEMTEPAVIDLLGNNATIDKAYVLNNDITFKNGTLIFDDYNGLDPDTYDPAGIYHAVMTIGAAVTFDNCILTGKDATAQQGIFVLGTNGVMSLTNGSELNVTAPTATAVIYSEGTGKLVVNDSKINIDGEGNAVRGVLAAELDADDAEITITNIADNAMRNVKGTVDSSVITIDGAEYGIKNKDYNEALVVTNSSITITNTVNEDDNAGIYLYSRDNLVETNSIVDGKIYVNDGTSDAVYNTLTFDTNGGSRIASVINEENAVVDLSEYRPTRSGYTFGGWYSDEDLLQNVASDTLDASKTVYAKWNKTHIGSVSSVTKYTLTFEANGGTAVSKLSKTKNTTVDLSEYVTQKEGFSFDGWYTDKELSNKATSVKLTKNTTVYAKWVEIIEEPDADVDAGDVADTGDVAAEWENPFADVAAEAWYYGNVRYVAENNLMNGTTEAAFSPNSSLTRAMLVTVLYRLEGEPATNKSIPFADVDMGAYYANAVSWAKQNGVVNGVTETEFAPDQSISREQIAAIMHRYAQYKGYDVSVGEGTNILSYSDFDQISEYAVASMQYAVGSGILRGKTEATLNPQDNATRAEIAAILQRFIEANNG